MSAHRVAAIQVCCDLCDEAKGPVACTSEEAEALAASVGILPWPRNGRHRCGDCRDYIEGTAKAGGKESKR